VEPVKAMQATLGSSTSASPTSWPVPVTTLITPGGRCDIDCSTRRSVASGVSSDDLMTTVLPAARAGAIFHTRRSSG